MDHANLFLTRTTYGLLRAEYAVGIVVSLVLVIVHVDAVRWLPFVGLFAYSDAIGYVPGAIAYRRAPDGRISRAYYVLYDAMHSILTAAAVAGLWAVLVKPEWALLAIPLHLCGDRAVFGNLMKSPSIHFEPKPHPVYARVADLLATPAWEVQRLQLSVSGGDGQHGPSRDEAVAAR